jgi:hypothetical protein
LITVQVRFDRLNWPLLILYTATPIDKQLHGEHYQANVVRAPEVILGHPWSSSVDVWSVGCLVSHSIGLDHLLRSHLITSALAF